MAAPSDDVDMALELDFQLAHDPVLQEESESDDDDASAPSFFPGLLPPAQRRAFHREAVSHMAMLREDLDASLTAFPACDLRRVARCHRLLNSYCDLRYPLRPTERVTLASSMLLLALLPAIDVPLQLNLLRGLRRLLAGSGRGKRWKHAAAFAHEAEKGGGVDPTLLLRVFERQYDASLREPRAPPRLSRQLVGDLRAHFADAVRHLRPYLAPKASLELMVQFLDEAERENGLAACLALDKAAFFRPFWPAERAERKIWDALMPRLLTLWEKRAGSMSWELNVLSLLRAATTRTHAFDWHEPAFVRGLLATLRQKFATSVATTGFSNGAYAEGRMSFWRGSYGKESLGMIYLEGASLVAFLVGKGPRAEAPEETLLPENLLTDAAPEFRVPGEGGETSDTATAPTPVRLGTLLVCQLFGELASMQFPSNAGWWSSGLAILLQHVAGQLAEFIGYQRGWATHLKDRATQGLPTETADGRVPACAYDLLPEADLQAVLRVLVPFAHRTMFHKDHAVSQAGLAALKHLGSICPRTVAAPTMPLVMAALSEHNLTQSHQVPLVLAFLTRSFKTLFYPRPVIAPFLIDILYSLLPGVDPNDDVKLQATLGFFFEVFAWVPIFTRGPASACPAPPQGMHPLLQRDNAGKDNVFGPGYDFANIDGTSTFVAARLEGAVPSGKAAPKAAAPKAAAARVRMEHPVVERDGTRADAVEMREDQADALTALPYRLGEWVPLFLDRIFEVIRASDHEDKESESAGVAEGVVSMVVEMLFFRCDERTCREHLPRFVAFFVEEAGRLRNGVRHCVYLAKALTCECSDDRARLVMDSVVTAMLGPEQALVSWLEKGGRSSEELFWRLRILAGVVRLAAGSVTKDFIERLEAVADAALLYNQPGSAACGPKHLRKAGGKLARGMLRSLLQMKVTDGGDSRPAWIGGGGGGGDESGGQAEAMPEKIPGWYRPGFVTKEEQLHFVRWYVPGPEEVGVARRLLDKYLVWPMLEVARALGPVPGLATAAAMQAELEGLLARSAGGDAASSPAMPAYLGALPPAVPEAAPFELSQCDGLTRRLQILEYAVRGASGSLPDFDDPRGDDVLFDVGHACLEGRLNGIRSATMGFVSLLFDATVGETVLSRVLLEPGPLQPPAPPVYGPLGGVVAEEPKFLKRLADVMRIVCNDRQYVYNEDDHDNFILAREDLNHDAVAERYFAGATECNAAFGLADLPTLSFGDVLDLYEPKDAVYYLVVNKACIALANRQRRMAQLVPKALLEVYHQRAGGEDPPESGRVPADWVYGSQDAQVADHATRVWHVYARLLGLGAHKVVEVGSRALDGVQVLGDSHGAFHTAALKKMVQLLDAPLWKPLVKVGEGDESGLGPTLAWENLDTIMNFLRLRSSVRKLNRKWHLGADYFARICDSWRLLPLVPKENEEVLCDYIHELGRSVVQGYVLPLLATSEDKARLETLIERLLVGLGNDGTGPGFTEVEVARMEGEPSIVGTLEDEIAASAGDASGGMPPGLSELLIKLGLDAGSTLEAAQAALQELPPEERAELQQAMVAVMQEGVADAAPGPRVKLQGGFISKLHWRFELLSTWLLTVLFQAGEAWGNVPESEAIAALTKAEAERCHGILMGPRVAFLAPPPEARLSNPRPYVARTPAKESNGSATHRVRPALLERAASFLLASLCRVADGQLVQRVLLGFFQRVVCMAQDPANPMAAFFQRCALSFLTPVRYNVLLRAMWCDRTSSREQDDEVNRGERSWATGVKEIIWDALRAGLDAHLPRATDVVTVDMDGFRVRHAHCVNRLLALDVGQGLEAIPLFLTALHHFLDTDIAAELLSRYSTASGIFGGVLAALVSATRDLEDHKETGEKPRGALGAAWESVVGFLRAALPKIPMDTKQDWACALLFAMENCFLRHPDGSLTYEMPAPRHLKPVVTLFEEELWAQKLWFGELGTVGEASTFGEDYSFQEKVLSFAVVVHHGCCQYTERWLVRGETPKEHQEDWTIHRHLGLGLARGGIKALLHPYHSTRNVVGGMLAVLTQSMASPSTPVTACFAAPLIRDELEEARRAVEDEVAALHASHDVIKAHANPVEVVVHAASAAAAGVVTSPSGLVGALAGVADAADAALTSMEEQGSASDDAGGVEARDSARQSLAHVRGVLCRFAVIACVTRRAFATSLDVSDALAGVLPAMLRAMSDTDQQTRDTARGVVLYSLARIRRAPSRLEALGALSGDRGVRSASARVREIAAVAVQGLVAANGCGLPDAARRHAVLLLIHLCSDSRPEVVSHAQMALGATLERGGPWLGVRVATRCSAGLAKRLRIVRKMEKRRRESAGGDEDAAVLAKRKKEVLVLLRVIGACFRCFAYDLPDFMPSCLALLHRATVTAGVKEWPEVRDTVRQIVSEFRRTHVDNFEQMERLFKEDELEALGGFDQGAHYYV